MFLDCGQNAVQPYRHDREPIGLGQPGGMVVSPALALQLQLQTNVSQLMAIDKDALEIGDGEHASHARTC